MSVSGSKSRVFAARNQNALPVSSPKCHAIAERRYATGSSTGWSRGTSSNEKSTPATPPILSPPSGESWHASRENACVNFPFGECSPRRLYAMSEDLELVVFGAHLRGGPLSHQLTDLDAQWAGEITTAPRYRMSVLSTVPPKPAITRVPVGAPAPRSWVIGGCSPRRHSACFSPRYRRRCSLARSNSTMAHGEPDSVAMPRPPPAPISASTEVGPQPSPRGRSTQ